MESKYQEVIENLENKSGDIDKRTRFALIVLLSMYENLKDRYLTTINIKNEEIDTLQKEIIEKIVHIDKITLDKIQIEESLTILQQEYKNSEDNLRKKNDEIIALHHIKEQDRTKIEESLDKLREKNDKIDALQKKIDNVTLEVTSLQQESDSQTTQIKYLKLKLIEKNEELEKEMKQFSEVNKEYTSAVKVLDETKLYLARQVEETKKAREELETLQEDKKKTEEENASRSSCSRQDEEACNNNPSMTVDNLTNENLANKFCVNQTCIQSICDNTDTVINSEKIHQFINKTTYKNAFEQTELDTFKKKSYEKIITNDATTPKNCYKMLDDVYHFLETMLLARKMNPKYHMFIHKFYIMYIPFKILINNNIINSF